MKKYKVLSTISYDGKTYKDGEIVELDDKFAYLIGSNLELIHKAPIEIDFVPDETDNLKTTNKKGKL